VPLTELIPVAVNPGNNCLPKVIQTLCTYCISYYFWQFLIMAVGLIFISFGRRDQWN